MTPVDVKGGKSINISALRDGIEQGVIAAAKRDGIQLGKVPFIGGSPIIDADELEELLRAVGGRDGVQLFDRLQGLISMDKKPTIE
jgi:hypothetical protein